MREMDEHAARRHSDLDYEDVPDGPIPVPGLDGSLVADSVVARATVFTGEGEGGAKVVGPAVVLSFSTGVAGGVPDPVVTVVFVGSPDGMRRFGKLVRDASNGAANAAERATS